MSPVFLSFVLAIYSPACIRYLAVTDVGRLMEMASSFAAFSIKGEWTFANLALQLMFQNVQTQSKTIKKKKMNVKCVLETLENPIGSWLF